MYRLGTCGKIIEDNSITVKQTNISLPLCGSSGNAAKDRVPRVAPNPSDDIINPRPAGPTLNISDAYTGINPWVLGTINR